VWLAGEAVCTRPEIAGAWPTPPAGPPFYGVENPGPVVVTLPGKPPATLIRFRSTARPGWLDRLLGRPWRSPAANLARVYFHLERAGVPVPRLLAFGQRRAGLAAGESFVLYAAVAHVLPLGGFVTAAEPESRRRVLFATGAVLRSIHDAGCRFDRRARGAEFVRVGEAGEVVVDPTAGLRKVRSVASAGRDRDLRRLFAAVFLSRPDRLRLLAGYHAGDGRDRLRPAARNHLGALLAR
jgi:hypothetical protein